MDEGRDRCGLPSGQLSVTVSDAAHVIHDWKEEKDPPFDIYVVATDLISATIQVKFNPELRAKAITIRNEDLDVIRHVEIDPLLPPSMASLSLSNEDLGDHEWIRCTSRADGSLVEHQLLAHVNDRWCPIGTIHCWSPDDPGGHITLPTDSNDVFKCLPGGSGVAVLHVLPAGTGCPYPVGTPCPSEQPAAGWSSLPTAIAASYPTADPAKQVLSPPFATVPAGIADGSYGWASANPGLYFVTIKYPFGINICEYSSPIFEVVEGEDITNLDLTIPVSTPGPTCPVGIWSPCPSPTP